MEHRPQYQGIAGSITLLICRTVLVVLLAEQVIYYWLGITGQSVLGSLHRVFSADWMKDILSAQMILAALSLGFGFAPKLMALWSTMAIVALSSLYVQSGGVIPDFIAIRFWVFIAAATPVVLFGGGGFSVFPQNPAVTGAARDAPMRHHLLSRQSH